MQQTIKQQQQEIESLHLRVNANEAQSSEMKIAHQAEVSALEAKNATLQQSMAEKTRHHESELHAKDKQIATCNQRIEGLQARVTLYESQRAEHIQQRKKVMADLPNNRDMSPFTIRVHLQVCQEELSAILSSPTKLYP
jgi:hypothetical protein